LWNGISLQIIEKEFTITFLPEENL
jgi:hypothetical protein